MGRDRPIGGWAARALMALCLLALAARVALPAGTMLSADAGEGPTLVICTLEGPKTIAGDAAFGVPEPDRGEATPDQPCPFAGVSGVALVAGPASIALPAPPPVPAPVWSPAAPRPGLGLVAPPPPATGPPALV
jgi:hypothetical protein